MNALQRLHRATDTWLWAHGVRSHPIRDALCVLFWLALASVVAALLLLPLTRQVFCFFLGIVFTAANVLALNKNVTRLLAASAHSGRGAGGGARLLAVLGSFARLLVVLAVCALCIRFEPRLVIGLAAGITTGVMVLLLCGLRGRNHVD